jgi:hypothetical protein
MNTVSYTIRKIAEILIIAEDLTVDETHTILEGLKSFLENKKNFLENTIELSKEGKQNLLKISPVLKTTDKTILDVIKTLLSAMLISKSTDLKKLHTYMTRKYPDFSGDKTPEKVLPPLKDLINTALQGMAAIVMKTV